MNYTKTYRDYKNEEEMKHKLKMLNLALTSVFMAIVHVGLATH